MMNLMGIFILATEGSESLDWLWALGDNLIAFSDHPLVRTAIQAVLVIVYLVLSRSNKNLRKRLSDFGETTSKLFGSTDKLDGDTQKLIENMTEVMKKEGNNEAKIDYLTQTNALMFAVLEKFIKGTKISVEDKIEIAKTLDEFKSLKVPSDSDNIEKKDDEEDIEERKETIKEFVESDKKATQEQLEEMDAYLQSMKLSKEE